MLAMLKTRRVERRQLIIAIGWGPGGKEGEETLEAGAVVRELADAVEHKVHDLLADGVVAAGVVVGGILLARD